MIARVVHPAADLAALSIGAQRGQHQIRRRLEQLAACHRRCCCETMRALQAGLAQQGNDLRRRQGLPGVVAVVQVGVEHRQRRLGGERRGAGAEAENQCSVAKP